MASRKGFEPLTYGLGNRCSILLSYRDMRQDHAMGPRSAPWATRLWSDCRSGFKCVRQESGKREAGAPPVQNVSISRLMTAPSRRAPCFQHASVMRPCRHVDRRAPSRPSHRSPEHCWAEAFCRHYRKPRATAARCTRSEPERLGSRKRNSSLLHRHRRDLSQARRSVLTPRERNRRSGASSGASGQKAPTCWA